MPLSAIVSRTVRAGRKFVDMFEGMYEMALIAKSRVGGDVGHGGGGAFQQLPCPIEPKAQRVFCWRFLEGFLEQPAEMRFGKAGKLRKPAKGDSFAIVLVDVLERRLQTVAGRCRAVSFDGVESAHRSNQFALAVVNRKDAVSGGVRVTVHGCRVDAVDDRLSGFPAFGIPPQARLCDRIGKEVARFPSDGIELVIECGDFAIAAVQGHDPVGGVFDVETDGGQIVHQLFEGEHVRPGFFQEGRLKSELVFSGDYFHGHIIQ